MKTGEEFILSENEDLSDVEEVMHSSLLNLSDLSMQLESMVSEEKDDEDQGEEEDEEEDYDCTASEIMNNAVCSTPVKMKERLSVSLMDVSGLGNFPLGDGVHRSSETLKSSCSTVTKSKDSGYNHSGSSLSVGSSTDHLPVTNYDRVESKVKKYIEETKRLSSSTIQPCESEKKKCFTDIESFRKLREELEFKDVMISALQESNNSLRMKWADAQNKITELRMMSVQHCTCCPRKTKRGTDGGGWVERTDLMNETDNCVDSSTDVPPSETIASFMSSASRIQARRALATAVSIGRMASATQELTEARQADQHCIYHDQSDQNYEKEEVGDHGVNATANINLPAASRLSPHLYATSSIHPHSLLPASRPNIYLPGDDPLDRVKVWQKSLHSPNSNMQEDQKPNQDGKEEIKNRLDVIGSCLGGRGDPETEERTGGGGGKLSWENKNKTQSSWGAGGSSDWDGLHFRVFDAHISSWGPSRPQYSTNKMSTGSHKQQCPDKHKEKQSGPGPNPVPLRSPLLLQSIQPSSSPTNTNPSRRYLVENNNNTRISSVHNNINLSTATAVISSSGNNYCWLRHGKRYLYECLNEADRLAEELSTGLAKIPIDLENIRSRTHLTLGGCNFQHRVK